MSGGWLDGYAALVTGGGSGIGRAVAERFLAEGASVTILGRDQDKLDDVRKRPLVWEHAGKAERRVATRK